jgi:glycerate kinase
VAAALARGVESAGGEAIQLPLADGGEGTAQVLLGARGGRMLRAPATDPLGRAIEAELALLGDGTRAVLDSAAASGLTLLGGDERDAWQASSRGTGELIVAAARAGAERILVAAGGSATTDGGVGAIIAIAAAGGLGNAHITVLCDVDLPFERAAPVFAPQKGADPATVELLERRMDAIAGWLPTDPRGVAHTGAAGGLSGGLWACFDAELVSGADYVLDAVRFEERLSEAGALVVGEGRLDEQTFAGKIVGPAARRAQAARIPVYAVAAQNELAADAAADLGLAAIMEASSPSELERAGHALWGRLARA